MSGRVVGSVWCGRKGHYRVGPVLENTAFTAIFFQSTGLSGFGPYGYVDAKPTGAP